MKDVVLVCASVVVLLYTGVFFAAIIQLQGLRSDLVKIAKKDGEQ